MYVNKMKQQSVVTEAASAVCYTIIHVSSNNQPDPYCWMQCTQVSELQNLLSSKSMAYIAILSKLSEEKVACNTPGGSRG